MGGAAIHDPAGLTSQAGWPDEEKVARKPELGTTNNTTATGPRPPLVMIISSALISASIIAAAL